MANYKEDIVDIELENGTVHRSFLNHTLGSGDEKANRFGVRTFRNGEPESVSNGCYGYFIRADGTTVGPIEGVITGADSNKAYVTLPAACYAIEGNFQLAIKVTTTTTSGTLRIIDGVVSKTTTDTIVDPGTVVDSVDELVQAIEDAIAAIPEDYTPTLAPAFAADTANDPASYVVYDGKFYLLPDGHTAGTAWSSTTKTETKVGPEITQLRKVAFKSAEASVASNDLNNCKVGYVMLSSGTTYTHAPYNTGKVAHVLTYGSYLTGTDANRYLIQYYFTDGSTTGEVWRRTRSSGTWGDWAKIYDGVGIFRSAQTAVASNDLDNCEVGYVFLDYSSTYTHAPYDDNRVAHVVT